MRRAIGPAWTPARLAPAVLLVGLALGLVPGLVPGLPATAAAQEGPADPAAAFRDSLRQEITRYSELIAALRDSVEALERAEDPRRERLARVERSIGALNRSLGSLTGQLSALQLEIEEGEVRLRDQRGGEVTLEIPPDLPDQLREGLSSLSRVILEEMPDTLHIGDQESGFTWSWSQDGIDIRPVAPPPQKRTIEGGLVKFRDPLRVAADEVVLGDVVAILGDAEVSGHVRGDLVVVLGHLRLDDGAVVEGEVISVLGGVDRADGASVGALTVIDPGLTLLPGGDLGLLVGGWAEFGVWQAMFLLLLLLVVILLAAVPRPRLLAVAATLEGRPLQSIGAGMVLGLLGHVAVLGLAAILVLTVIGIPVALLLVLALGLLDLLAVGVAGLATGRRFCARLALGCGHPWRETFLGLVVLHLPALLAGLVAAAGAAPLLVLLLVWLGRLVKILAFCAGLGALLLGRLGAAAARAQTPLGDDLATDASASPDGPAPRTGGA
jgi:hypothetical protein